MVALSMVGRHPCLFTERHRISSLDPTLCRTQVEEILERLHAENSLIALIT